MVSSPFTTGTIVAAQSEKDTGSCLALANVRVQSLLQCGERRKLGKPWKTGAAGLNQHGEWQEHPWCTPAPPWRRHCDVSKHVQNCQQMSKPISKYPKMSCSVFLSFYVLWDSLLGTKCISSSCTTVQDKMFHCVLNSTYCNSYCPSCPHVLQDMMVQHSNIPLYVPNLYNSGTNCPSCPHVPQDRMVQHSTSRWAPNLYYVPQWV